MKSSVIGVQITFCVFFISVCTATPGRLATLTQEEENQAKEAFVKYAGNICNRLSMEALGNALREVGVKDEALSSNDLEIIYDSADGPVDERGFLELRKRWKEFRSLDRDKNGFVTNEDIKTTLLFTPADAALYIKSYDQDNDGMISFADSVKTKSGK